jgi:hypothetical protein
MADEVQHVRFANHWIKHMATSDPTVLLRVAVAMTALRNVNAALKPREGEMSVNGKPLGRIEPEMFRTSAGDRDEAGFNPAEISEVADQDSRQQREPQLSADARVQRILDVLQVRRPGTPTGNV